MLPQFYSSISELSARDLAMLVLLVKATIILLAAFGITVAMHRASAGARHLVWLVALGTLLIVPVLTAWAPLRFEILPAASAGGGGIDRIAGSAGKPGTADIGGSSAAASLTAVPAPIASSATLWARISTMSALSIVLGIWGAIALGIAASLGWSALVVRRLVRQASPLDSEGWTSPLYEVADRLGLEDAPRLLRSEEAKMPFACGVFRPTIVLPAESDAWTLDRRRAVLLHELAHVRRRDLVGHTLGRLACALYWFHPLVWTAARELRSESERACDDLALSCGTQAADYAEHLLDIVISVRRDVTPSVALAMARRKEFEGRMLAILDPQLRRSSPSRTQSAALVGSLAVIALVVGAAAPARRVQGQQSTDTARTEQPFEQHSAPGGFRKEQKQETRFEQRLEKKTERIAQRIVGEAVPRVTQHVVSAESSAEAVAWLRQLASAPPTANAPDDRPVLLARILRTDSSAELRRIAAWGLSEYADTDVAVDALANAVGHDKDVNVREMAAWALGEGSDRSSTAADALAGALKSDASVNVRATAAWALGNIGSRVRVPALVAALADASPEVRRRALWAIGNAEPREAPRQVIEMLKDKDPEVRELAAWALYEIEDPQAASALNAALKVETNKDLQISYIRAIAAMGEKSIDAIRELLESPDPKVKSMAVRALAGGDAAGPWPWPWPEPRPSP